MAEEQKDEISGASQLPPTDGAAAASAAAAAPPATPMPAAPAVWPFPWRDLQPFDEEETLTIALDVACAAEAVLLPWLLANFDASPDPAREVASWGLLSCPVSGDATELLRYIRTRPAVAESLFIHQSGLHGERVETGDFEALTPSARAQFELAVRLVPAVAEAIAAINAEISRRLPPPEPGKAVPVPIEDTIFEEVPGFGDRMER